MYPAKLDDKGRIKVPAVFARYLESLSQKTLFVTSLDGITGQIYPIAIWEQNEAFFEQYTEDPDTAQNVIFTANELGAETEMDSQGRIGFSPELRRALGIENQPVKIYFQNGVIQVLNDQVYEQNKGKATQDPAGDVRKLRNRGLK
jgi:MraZ protein